MKTTNERTSDQGRKARALKLWERLTWPQVAALLLTMAGLAGIAHALPPEFWASIDWSVVVSAILAVLGIGGGAVAGPLFRGTHEGE
jgi:hypothetical protein